MPTKEIFDQILNTQEKKLAFFQNIVMVAIADRYVDKLESDFLVTLGNQLQLTPEETMPIADNLSTLQFIIPEEDLQKSLELEVLVQMVLQDGKVEDREYNLCLEYTRRSGFTKQTLDDLISQNRN